MQNLLLVEDHQFVIDAIEHALSNRFQIVQARDSQQMQRALRRGRPQLVVLGLQLAGRGDSLHLLQELVEQGHKIIAISNQAADGIIRACMYLGAHGFLDKTGGIAQLLLAIDAVLNGHYMFPPELILRILHEPAEALPALTKGELRVLEQIMQTPMPGNLEIASSLCISPGRVKNIITMLFEKFNVEKRQDLHEEARRRGYFPGMHAARLGHLRPLKSRR